MVEWRELPLTEEHASYLSAHAVTPEMAQVAGVYSITSPAKVPYEFQRALHTYGDGILPALVFNWRNIHGNVWPQMRTALEGEETRYLWSSKGPAQLGAFWPAENAHTILIVEGTKQALAAAGYAPEGHAVYAIAGCRGYMHEGAPTPDLRVCYGKQIIIVLDADAGSNPEVYTAGKTLGDAALSEGAVEVRFVRLPAGKKAGLDDLLGPRAPEERAAYLQRLLNAAKPKPADVKPQSRKQERSTPSAKFFNESGGLLTATLATAILDEYPVALTADHQIALYRDGVYQVNSDALLSAVADLLGEDYRSYHHTTVREFLRAGLLRQKQFLPEFPRSPWLNLENGMLDLATLELHPHDPEHMSTNQFPLAWDPEATCPTYEWWLQEQLPEQMADLEETISAMLAPQRTIYRHIFAYGLPRTGKDTVNRLIMAIAGEPNTASVTLHQVCKDRFAAADL
jgi:putative DNA primase/helicase